MQREPAIVIRHRGPCHTPNNSSSHLPSRRGPSAAHGTGREVFQQSVDVGRSELVALRSVVQGDATELVASAGLARLFGQHLVHDFGRIPLVLQSTAGEAQRAVGLTATEPTALSGDSDECASAAVWERVKGRFLRCIGVVLFVHVVAIPMVPHVRQRVERIIAWDVQVLVRCHSPVHLVLTSYHGALQSGMLLHCSFSS